MSPEKRDRTVKPADAVATLRDADGEVLRAPSGHPLVSVDLRIDETRRVVEIQYLQVANGVPKGRHGYGQRLLMQIHADYPGYHLRYGGGGNSKEGAWAIRGVWRKDQLRVHSSGCFRGGNECVCEAEGWPSESADSST